MKLAQQQLRNEVKDTDIKTVRGMFMNTTEERNNMDLAWPGDGPLRRVLFPYVVESSDQLAADVKTVFNKLHTTEALMN